MRRSKTCEITPVETQDKSPDFSKKHRNNVTTKIHVSTKRDNCYKISKTEESDNNYIFSPNNISKIATLNSLRSMDSTVIRGELTWMCIEKHISILAVQEHQIKSSEKHAHVKEVGWGWKFIYFSSPDHPLKGGLGFIVSPEINVLGIEEICQRIIILKVKSFDKCVKGLFEEAHLVNVYAPHSGLNIEEREIFFEELEESCQNFNLFSICGDMNATIPVGRCKTLFSKGSSRSIGSRQSSELLCSTMEALSMVSVATRRHNDCKATFYDTKSKKGRQIDHIFFPERFMSSVRKVFTFDSPTKSDHRVVTAEFKLKLGKEKTPMLKKRNYSVIKTDPVLTSKLQDIIIGNKHESYEEFESKVAEAISIIPIQDEICNVPGWVEAQELITKENTLANKSSKYAIIADKQYRLISTIFNEHITCQAAKAWQIFKSLNPPKSSLPDLPVETYFKHFEEQRLHFKTEGTAQTVEAVIVSGPWTIGRLSENELVNATRIAQNNRAVGPDNTPNEILKIAGVPESLIQFYDSAYDGNPPSKWLLSTTVPVFKKGDKSNLINYRQICLMCHPAKIFNIALLIRLRNGLDKHLRYNQNGFRQQRGTVQHTLCLRRVMELSKNKNVFLLFIDFCSAFDSIYWYKMKEVLQELGVPDELITAVMAMYIGASTYVKTPNGPTDIFRVWAGVLQGDTLAPYLFICVIDVILRRIFKKFGIEIGFKFESVTGETVYITDLDFADDLVIIVESEENAEMILKELQILSKEYGLEVNFAPGKTEIITLGKKRAGKKY